MLGEGSLFEVTITQILTILIKCGITLTVIVMTFLGWLIPTIFSIIGVILAILTLVSLILGPIFVVFMIIYFAVSAFWDDGAKPIMEIIQMAIGFVVELWNSAVRALKKFGVNLDEASGFGQGIPTFWEFLKYIVYILVWKPLEAALKGAIIR
jgi:phage-related protein